MRHSLGYRRGRSVRLLFCSFVVLLCLSGAGITEQAEVHSTSQQGFIELDGEIQAIKEEILRINRDILLLKELALGPPGEQLVVLVSIVPPGAVVPATISLQLDGRAVSRHEYTPGEGDALLQGGMHRLYAGRLGEGEHKLDVSLSGTRRKDRAFSLQNSVSFTKQPGKKYLELQLGMDERGRQPDLTVRQWQQ